jgi:hypothetical protein
MFLPRQRPGRGRPRLEGTVQTNASDAGNADNAGNAENADNASAETQETPRKVRCDEKVRTRQIRPKGGSES